MFSIFLRAIYLSLKINFYFCKFQVKCQAFKNKNYVKKQHLKFASFTNNNNIPSIFTLHDFWLMCPRGQFIQRNSKEPWELCDGQEDSKCVKQCSATHALISPPMHPVKLSSCKSINLPVAFTANSIAL